MAKSKSKRTSIRKPISTAPPTDMFKNFLEQKQTERSFHEELLTLESQGKRGYADDFSTGGISTAAKHNTMGLELSSSDSWVSGADHFATAPPQPQDSNSHLQGVVQGEVAANSSQDQLPGVESLTFAPNKRLLGRYRLKKQLGQGAMGQVWSAQDQVHDRMVAIKRLHPILLSNPDLLRRFARECSILSALTNRYVVKFHDSHLSYGFFTMELLEGQTLAGWTKTRGRFSLVQTIVTLLQICKGLESIHRNGLIHRDLKPTNIHLETLENGWLARILDFGIAWTEQGTQLTQTANGAMGTPYYIAPELLKGETPTNKVDIYSLGVMLFEMHTGEVPLAGSKSLEEATKRLIEEGLISTSECPPEMQCGYLALIRNELEPLLNKMLDGDPEARCNVSELKGKLKSIYKSYRTLSTAGQTTCENTIQALLELGDVAAARKALDEAAKSYPKYRMWEQLHMQIDAEEERKASIAAKLQYQWNTGQETSEERKRRSTEASIIEEWRQAAKNSPWPACYKSDPFGAMLEAHTKKPNTTPWYQRKERLGACALGLVLLFCLTQASALPFMGKITGFMNSFDSIRFGQNMVSQHKTSTAPLAPYAWEKSGPTLHLSATPSALTMAGNDDLKLFYKHEYSSHKGVLAWEADIKVTNHHSASWGWLKGPSLASFVLSKQGKLIALLDPRASQTQKQVKIPNIKVTEWHRYRVEISRKHVVFSIDDNVVARIPCTKMQSTALRFHLGQETTDKTHKLQLRNLKIHQENMKSILQRTAAQANLR